MKIRNERRAADQAGLAVSLIYYADRLNIRVPHCIYGYRRKPHPSTEGRCHVLCGRNELLDPVEPGIVAALFLKVLSEA